jgi:hypothetical protein
LHNIGELLSFQSYTFLDDKNERVVNTDNFIPSREYDRIMIARIQSNQYNNHNNDAKRGKGLIADNSKIRKAKTILVVDDDQKTTLAVKSGLENENSHTTNGISYLVHTYIFRHWLYQNSNQISTICYL